MVLASGCICCKSQSRAHERGDTAQGGGRKGEGGTLQHERLPGANVVGSKRKFVQRKTQPGERGGGGGA